MLLDSKKYVAPQNNIDNKDDDKYDNKDVQIVKPLVRHCSSIKLEEDNNNNNYDNDNNNISNVKWEDSDDNKDIKNGDTEKSQETFNNIVVQQVWHVNDCAKTVSCDDDVDNVAVVSLTPNNELNVDQT